MIESNPDFMVDANRVEPPVGQVGLIYVFHNPEDDKEYFIHWTHYDGRDKSQDYRCEAMARQLGLDAAAQDEIDELNDLYKRS